MNRAGLSPSDIDYINLHGTASQKNDEVEARIVAELFPEVDACQLDKGLDGSCARRRRHPRSGDLAARARARSSCRACCNTRELDAACGPQIRFDNGEGVVRNVMSNSFGFGGSNVLLLACSIRSCGGF